MSNNPEMLRLKYEIGQLFTPATPINEKSLFADRPMQVSRVIEVISQRGQHAIIFGERGVGKTSLANVLASYLQGFGKTVVAPRVAVDSSDDFESLWRKVFDAIVLTENRESMGLKPESEQVNVTISQTVTGNITPNVVCQVLNNVGRQCLLILVIDEFDRMAKAIDVRLIADTIKTISDSSVPATLVLVGVAESVDELIEGHESVNRNLVQVPMPRMNKDELIAIVNSRLPKLNMSVTDAALRRIVIISRGLPHYTHLISQHSAWNAIEQNVRVIDECHVKSAMQRAIDNSQQSLQAAYHTATTSPQKGNLYGEVLLACALAPCDEFGYFAPADIRVPMKKITSKDYEIPSFSRHLAAFSSTTRAEILQSKGDKYQRRFRFRNPLMQPYVIMRGIAGNLIDFDDLEQIK